MSLFANLTSAGLEENTDRLGGGRALVETDRYDLTIKLAYVTMSGQQGSKAMALNLLGTVVVDGKEVEYKDQFWITNRDGNNFNLTDGGKKNQMGGFADVNDLCLIALGRELHQVPTEQKLVNIWDSSQSKEVPTSADHITALEGLTVGALIQKRSETIQKEVNGKWTDTQDTREKNQIQKFFDIKSGYTVVEAKRLQATPGLVIDAPYVGAWVEKYKGTTYDATRKSKGGGAAGAAPARPAAGTSGSAGSAAPSLFGG